MTISYPLDFPIAGDVAPNDLELRIVNTTAISVSPFTGKEQKQVFANGKWFCEINFPPLTYTEAAPLFGFLASLKGREGTFTLGPQGDSRTPRGTGGGTPLVDGGSQEGSNVLVSDGWNASETVLQKGDFISIDNRLYLVGADVVSDGSGDASIDVFPALRSHADNAAIVTTNPKGTWRLENDVQSVYRLPSNGFYRVRLRAIEDRS